MALATGPDDEAEPRAPVASEAGVAEDLRALGVAGPTGSVSLLAGGRSGARVLLLETGGERVVLKVTADPAWRPGALRELAVYRTGGPRAASRPALLAAHDDGVAVRLLLTAHEPYPPAPALTEDAWLGVAAALGRLHGLPVPPGRWRRPPGPARPAEVAAGRRGWERHGQARVAGQAARRLADPVDVGPGPVLVHGDCHVGNLVRGPGGRPCWVDWQEAGLGSGLGDLVFLWQRAEFDGARPPRTAMTAVYADARGLQLDDRLRSALDAAELRLLLIAWPPFLGYGSADGRQVLAERLAQLATGHGAVAPPAPPH